MNDIDLDRTGNLAGHGLRPIKDQVLVRQDAVPNKLHSGLYVPDACARELQEDFGVVLAVGPRVVDVRVGDRVLFQRRACTALIPDRRFPGPAEWKDLLMLRETDIVGVVELD